MGATLVVAILLHLAIAMWFSLAQPQPIKKSEPIAPLRVNLMAMVAETTKSAARPIIKPLIKSKPKAITAEPKLAASKPKLIAPKPKPLKAKHKPLKSKATPLKPKSKPIKPAPNPVLKPEKIATPQSIKDEPEPILAVAAEEPILALPDTQATARYEQLLVAWLEKHKQYPRRAKRMRIEGEGMLRILIDHNGNTLEISFEERTGHRFLDKAALDMAQRANPFPAMAENDPRQKLEFIVPVAFVLQ